MNPANLAARAFFAAGVSLLTVAAQDHEPLLLAAPDIVVVTRRAVLLPLEGEPVLRDSGRAGLKRVVNTPALLFYWEHAARYLFFDGDGWREARHLAGPWPPAHQVPRAAVAHLGPHRAGLSRLPLDLTTGTSLAQVVIATRPTELLSIDGDPRWMPIAGTDLTYADNTEHDLFFERESRTYYALVAGRWFSSPSLFGPWSHVSATALPDDFASIPEDSPKVSVRVSVPGTRRARHAVEAATELHTGVIDRSRATLDVAYDGEPVFASIDGTGLELAFNTSDFVIRARDATYCCSHGAWFVSTGPRGPWSVAIAVPDEVYAIPPASAAYPVTFVVVVAVTADAVTFGYTSGYLDTYTSDGVVVKGTSYSYPSWFGEQTHRRPGTWGFGFTVDERTRRWRTTGGYYDLLDTDSNVYARAQNRSRLVLGGLATVRDVEGGEESELSFSATATRDELYRGGSSGGWARAGAGDWYGGYDDRDYGGNWLGAWVQWRAYATSASWLARRFGWR